MVLYCAVVARNPNNYYSTLLVAVGYRLGGAVWYIEVPAFFFLVSCFLGGKTGKLLIYPDPTREP